MSYTKEELFKKEQADNNALDFKYQEENRELKYKNLIKNMCPKCGDNLVFHKEYEYYMCPCDYVISDQEYSFYKTQAKIEQKQKEYHIPTMEENLEALNNL